MITFKGILGNNCGAIIDIESVDKRAQGYARYKEQGYMVTGGIETLRGFAKISDLAKASTIDKGYQRSKDQNHVKDISIFLDEGRPLSKFLPEIILVGNKDIVNLTPFATSGKISNTVLGEINNLENYTIEVAEKSLKRIDGNHRLEAGADKNIFISFAIILWPESEESFQENRDNEAFLFHFLNGKAKKLTPEENYKGLATSTTWTVEELKHVNPVIPYLQQFLKIIEKNRSFKKDFFLTGPLSQIAVSLQEIGDFSISQARFKKIIDSTLLALHDFHKFPYLKSEFEVLLPQLVFINFYYDKPLEYLATISSWLMKYKYERGSFENAKNLYDISEKQLRVVHLKVFVAMPFWKDAHGNDDLKEVIRYNKVYSAALKETVGTENPHINLELIPIMLRRGKVVRIDSQLLKEIEEADIFIGDTTENNDNVIFEIGYAMALKKPAFIVRKKSFTDRPPFDIDKLIYRQYDDDDNFEVSLKKTVKLNLTTILKDDFDLIVNKSIESNKGTEVNKSIESNKDIDANKRAEKEFVKLKPNQAGADVTENTNDEDSHILSHDDTISREIEEYEEMFILEAERAVSHALSTAEWDYDNGVIEIKVSGKIVKIKTFELLEKTLEEIAIDAGFGLIPGEGEERETIYENTDWDAIVQGVLSNYNNQLEELGWERT